MADIDPKLDVSIRSVLYPLARMLLHEGVGVRPVIRILKEAFVAAAVREHRGDGKNVSTSKAAALTGLTRKEVAEIRQTPGRTPDIANAYVYNEGATLSVWCTEPEFQDATGSPRRLELGPGEGTFADLVSKSIDPSLGTDHLELLDRLIRRRCVKRNDDDTVELVRRDMDVSRDLPHIMEYAIGTVVDTVDKNWRRWPDNILTQRTTSTTGVTAEYIPLIRRKLRSRIVRFTEEIDDLLIDAEHTSAEKVAGNDDEAPLRVGVGVHYFEVDPPND